MDCYPITRLKTFKEPSVRNSKQHKRNKLGLVRPRRVDPVWCMTLWTRYFTLKKTRLEVTGEGPLVKWGWSLRKNLEVRGCVIGNIVVYSRYSALITIQGQSRPQVYSCWWRSQNVPRSVLPFLQGEHAKSWCVQDSWINTKRYYLGYHRWKLTFSNYRDLAIG